MPTIAFDLRHPEMMARELEEANRRLATEAQVPPSVDELLRDLCDQISETDAGQLEAIDPYLWIELQRAALKALQALHAGDPRAERHLVRVALEQLRFLLARLAERQPVAEDRPAADVVRWLDRTLPMSQRRVAELLGVAPRTYQRWISTHEPTAPGPHEEQRVRVLARLANQLRHSLGAAGIVDWLEHPRDELGGARPVDVLDDPDATRELLALAASMRSSVAA